MEKEIIRERANPKTVSNDDQDDTLLFALCQKVLSASQVNARLKQENASMSSENNMLQTEVYRRDQQIQELEISELKHQAAQNELKVQLAELRKEFERLKSTSAARENTVRTQAIQVEDAQFNGNQPDSADSMASGLNAWRKRSLSCYDTPLNFMRHRRKHQLLPQPFSSPSTDDSRPPTPLTNADTTLSGSLESLKDTSPEQWPNPVAPQAGVDDYGASQTDMEIKDMKERIAHQDSSIAQLQGMLQAATSGLVGTPGEMQLPLMPMMQPSGAALQLQLQQQQQQMSPLFAMQLEQLQRLQLLQQQQPDANFQGQSINSTAHLLQPSAMTTQTGALPVDVVDVSRAQMLNNNNSSSCTSAVTTGMRRQNSVTFAELPSVAEVTIDSASTHSSMPTQDSLDSDEVDSDEESFVEEQNALRKRLRHCGDEHVEHQ